MEQFDILDKNGNVTGLVAEKGSQLNKGQYYLGTHVYVFNSSLEFLLQQRAYDKKFLPGGWDVHLEHAIAGETSIECAIRGLEEEIGLVASKDGIRFLNRLVWDAYNHIIDVYFLQTDFDISKLSIQESEVIGLKAISKAEMLKLVEKMDYRPEEYRQLMLDGINKL